MTPTLKAVTNVDVTPAEEDLPNMISVDDHVMEPKELWQELQESRDQGSW